MSLSSAINTAQTIFNNTAAQTALVSKNIQNVSNADYSRRMAMLGTSGNGAQIVSIQRAQNDALMKQHSLSISQASAQDALLTGLEAVKAALGGNGYETSPSNYLKSFRDSLQTFAATPGNTSIAATTVSSASDLAKSLNKTSTSVQEVRHDADKEIDASVQKLNGLLSEFEKANSAVQGATASGSDASDALDQRDKLLRQISEIVGISTVTRANNDTVIYTSDGTVLFENSPRAVTFQPTSGFGATTTGNAIYVDGVALKAGKGADTTAEGTLFKENTTPATTALPGLFTWAGGTVPAAGTTVPGIAASLTINPLATANPTLVRDGGFNGPGYKSNTAGSSGYTALLDGFVTSLGVDMAFDPATGLDGSSSILDFSASSIGWLEELRSGASTANDNKTAMLSRTQDALSNVTGVSLDEELSQLLDLEQSYKASAKLVSTVDAMMTSLLQAVG
jgi:flagellar hook-associated protein 1 FlgK